MDNINNENFGEFLNDVKEVNPNEPEPEIPNEVPEVINNMNTNENILCCPHCSYIPRSHSKDKAKSMRNHMKSKHPEKLNTFLNNDTKKKEKKQNVQMVIEEIDNSSKIVENTDEKKLRLVSDLDVITAKFPTLWKNCPSYSYPESSIESLERIKSTYSKLINDKLTTKLAFNTLICLSKGAEQVSNSLGVCNLEGYADNIQQNEEELISIIDELISSQVLDMTQITPDIKLGICLLNMGIRTAESNKVKSNLNEVS